MVRFKRGALGIGLVVLTLLSAAVVLAQPGLPPENHYKTYLVTPPVPIVRPIILSDQFGSLTVEDLTLDRFSNPTQKILSDGTVFPILYPDLHRTWWRMQVPQPVRTIVGTDQFGVYPWELKDAVYLLNPALKDDPSGTEPPIGNHYLCYEALAAPLIQIPVTLADQFITEQVVVLEGKYFCNPVEKIDAGRTYPIVDYIVHLACYRVNNPSLQNWPVYILDQFVTLNTQVYFNDCLCVPALKEHPVPTERSTWGRVKSLYR
jgi:hypothetical protein